MTICFSFGQYGGFYISRGAVFRCCLGWFAITIFMRELDDWLDENLP